MVTSTKEKKQTKGHLQVISARTKQLPEIEGKSTSEEKHWALNILTALNPEDILNEFLPAEYTTELEVDEDLQLLFPQEKVKYVIVKHDNLRNQHTF
jgi:hypothetical protein